MYTDIRIGFMQAFSHEIIKKIFLIKKIVYGYSQGSYAFSHSIVTKICLIKKIFTIIRNKFGFI